MERASLWSARPENRHLPSIGEWANIRLLTRRRDWTEPQRRMMKRAGRLHGLRALGLAAVAAILLAVGLSIRDRVVEANRATGATASCSNCSRPTRGNCRRTSRPWRAIASGPTRS